MATTYPLWEDIYWTASGDSVSYKITNSAGVEVFVGKAHRLPGEDKIRVRLNDIFADSLGLRKTLFEMDDVNFDETGSGYDVFTVQNLNTGTSTSYAVMADYSYKYGIGGHSDPITHTLDRRQRFIPFTILNPNMDEIELEVENMTTGGVEYYYIKGPRTRIVQNINEEIIDIAYTDGLGFNGLFRLRDTGADYSLYYINAYGGWDTLLLGGRCSYSEKYARSGAKQVYDNTVQGARSKVDYINEVVRTYTLRTALLTDEQAAKMHHVLGTNTAILLDLRTNDLTPVTITNSSYEVKTYKGNGRKMTQYEITAEVAQDIIRR